MAFPSSKNFIVIPLLLIALGVLSSGMFFQENVVSAQEPGDELCVESWGSHQCTGYGVGPLPICQSQATQACETDCSIAIQEAEENCKNKCDWSTYAQGECDTARFFPSYGPYCEPPVASYNFGTGAFSCTASGTATWKCECWELIEPEEK